MCNDIEIIEKCLEERGVEVRVIDSTRPLTAALEAQIKAEIFAAEADTQPPFELILENQKIYICRHHIIDLHDPDSLDKVAKIVEFCHRNLGLNGTFVGRASEQNKHCKECSAGIL